jgi:branched-chain amino acid transport system ATP-binding protein
MLLEVANLDAFYGDLQALHGLDIEVDRGESVALVGANGAGKTTFMRCLAGLIEQKRGGITFGGNDISRMPAEAIARRGIALVPEGRMLFPSLNVEENLHLLSFGRPRHAAGAKPKARCRRADPRLFRHLRRAL